MRLLGGRKTGGSAVVGERNCFSSWEGRARSFSSGGGETGLWRERKGIFADGKGRFAGRECGGGYSSGWEGRARSFSSGGGETGLWREGTVSYTHLTLPTIA